MLDPDHPELRVGVLVWVQIDGQLSFPKPVAIEKIYEREGKKWFVVEGSATGLTADHLTLAATGADAQDPAAPPLRPAMLEPDRDQIEIFVDAIFRHAGDKGFVAVRSFLEHEGKVFRRSIADLAGGLRFLVDVCEDDARRAAQNPAPVVFCPPLAVFTGKDHAREQDVLLGLVLSVECDEHPQQAWATLEALLGRATVVVQSGGRWINGGGEPEEKLHLHWRLAKPAQGKDALANLKLARELAARLVGGDPSNAPICHPIRWPGSWHRKATPRLASIIAAFEVEIDLDEALELLRDASGAATFAGFGFKTNSKLCADDPAAVASALSVIPNDNLAWNDWNRIGMATWAATDGSEIGREAFAKWSAKASKNDPIATESRWQHYKTSPPTKIGFGTLVWLARQHSPGWIYKKAETGSNPGSSAPNQGPQGAGQGSQQAPPQSGKGKSGVGNNSGPTAPANSEEFLALVFIDHHEADLRFVAKWGQWFRWDGSRWALEETLQAFDMARLICREAANACNKHGVAKTLASAKTVAAVERLAKADRKLAATFEQWDTDPNKFNTSEGD